MDVVIWHNPRCSKSREALRLLEARGAAPRVVRYLETPPSRAELEEAARLLGARRMVRRKEAAFRERGLEGASDAELLDAMAEAPVLIERPVVFANGRAAIGRPPEAVLELL